VLQGYVQTFPLQTPTVPAGPAVHSALVQQLGSAAATQRLVPLQFRKPLLQVTPHVVPSQLAWPLAGGAAHCWQLAPQYEVLLAWHEPPQLCSGPWQTPLQAVPVAMQRPLHNVKFGLQWGTQLTPSQLTVPFAGATHGVALPQAEVPQLLMSVLAMHLAPHAWKPVLHASAQAPLWQRAVPFGSPGQATHAAPQAPAASFAAQVMPHLWKPVAQSKEQVVPSQVVWLAPAGLGHAVQSVPQEFTLVSSGQRFEQACEPVGQPPQAWVFGMHAPLQSTRSVGQVPPQLPATQVAVPFVIMGQDVQDDVPHVAGSASLTHLPLQSW
jgi:hypothetical protein